MKQIRLAFIGILLFFASVVSAEDYTGTWAGFLTARDNGKEIKMKCAITLTKNGSGDKYKGECKLTIEMNGQTYGIQTKVVASGNGSQLVFADQETIKQIGPDQNAKWCIKSGTLRLSTSGSKASLVGDVTGSGQSNCLPAKASLTKV